MRSESAGVTVELALDSAVNVVAPIDDVLFERAVANLVRNAVSVSSRGQRVEAEVILEKDPRLEAVLFEDAGREVTEAIRAFRASWLGSKVLP